MGRPRLGRGWGLRVFGLRRRLCWGNRIMGLGCRGTIHVRRNARPLRMRRLLLAIGGLVIAGCARAPRPTALLPDRSMVGLEFAQQIPGTTPLVARLLNTPGDHEYALHLVGTPTGERLVVTQLMGRNAARAPIYRVQAALIVPRYGRNEVVVVGACSLNGATDVDIVAIARRENAPELHRVTRAWRASGPNALLVPLEPAGIVCEHEGWRP